MTQLYTLRRTPIPGEFIITRFDSDYNVEKVYSVSKGACSAPDGHRPTCKHRKMLTLFATAEHIDDGWFLDWDTRMWQRPEGLAQLADQMLLDNAQASEPPSLGLRDTPNYSIQTSTKEISKRWEEGSKMQTCLDATCLTPNDCILNGCAIMRGETIEAIAERIAPTFMCETSVLATGRATAGSAQGPASVAPAATPPAPEVRASSPVAGGGLIKRRKLT